MNDNPGEQFGKSMAAEMQERVKERKCLKHITEAIDSSQNSKRIFQISLDALSSAMYYSDIACARILFRG